VKPIRILLADDHELVREGMRSIIENHAGWTVCGEASTGREALAKALELMPDLIMLDHALPEMNGVEVTRHLRRSLRVPILIVTMHATDSIVQEAFEAGANGYLLKSDTGRLPDAVETVLARGRFVSENLQTAANTGFEHYGAPRDLGSAALTPREREVLQLLAEGRKNKEIATLLGISTKTAETHRARIMTKLELHSIAELVHYAVRNHIIEP
jgi:DNA-binding NarL/FixJ family response regulator